MTSVNPDASNQNREVASSNRERIVQEIDQDGSFEDLAVILRSIGENIKDAYSCIMEYAYSDSEESEDIYRKYVVARAMIVGTNYIRSRYGDSENTFHKISATIQLLEAIESAGFLPQCADTFLQNLTSLGRQSGLSELPDTAIEVDVFDETSSAVPLSESYYAIELNRMKQLAGLL